MQRRASSKKEKQKRKKKRKKQNTSFHLFSLCTLVLCPWTTSIPLQLSSGVCRPTRSLHVLRIHPRIQVFLLPYVQSSWPGSNVSSDRVGRSIGQIVYKKKRKVHLHPKAEPSYPGCKGSSISSSPYNRHGMACPHWPSPTVRIKTQSETIKWQLLLLQERETEGKKSITRQTWERKKKECAVLLGWDPDRLPLWH